jgi:hypothetical protein
VSHTVPLNSARPAKRVARPTVGACSACDAPVFAEEASVRLYGETFHYDCVFYRRLSHRRAR